MPQDAGDVPGSLQIGERIRERTTRACDDCAIQAWLRRCVRRWAAVRDHAGGHSNPTMNVFHRDIARIVALIIGGECLIQHARIHYIRDYPELPEPVSTGRAEAPNLSG